MSKARGIAGVALVTLLSVASGFAAQGVTAGPAEKPSMFALPHQLTGEVVAVNQTTLVFTMRTSERTISLRTDPDTAQQLSTLKAGDRVKVIYKNSKGEMVATRIDPA
jgi:hypothetical protein